MEGRSGETGRTWFRSDRFLCMNGDWFFMTREGSQEGPYDSQLQAERDLCIYIRHRNDDFMREANQPDNSQP
ncbi:DUF6316 family protein [Aestuariirhabdus sp. Z084]|uniref:DUF6316 family protein n=1 Tax=Aestuariirhabdus haliotis TaxID=2918751 RepID=UPI00201B43B2|nr:DUF6316 family protein [Aestuariirhabdus haliotis]MCL6415387.1 DUF6316 family protein [Aestuariirhabdus haliotis]MCL6419143.1 DUF6316 family protein [Aestuariirhabdus haliotis]